MSEQAPPTGPVPSLADSAAHAEMVQGLHGTARNGWVDRRYKGRLLSDLRAEARLPGAPETSQWAS